MTYQSSRFFYQFAILGGNLLEWYEFSLYGFMSVLFAKIFFPTHSTFLSLLLTFASLAVSFIMRPFGGLLLGYLGDQYGRRKLLILSSFCMTLITLLMGFLPSYDTIGIWSPVLLVLLRLLGGFAISSELTGATLYQLEQRGHENNKNFLASLVQSGVFIGSFLASFSILLVSLILSQQQLLAGCWRMLYFGAAGVGIVVIVLRFQLPELPTLSRDPLPWRLLVANWPRFIQGFLLPAAGTAGLYYIIYQMSYMTHLIGSQYSVAMLITVLSNLGLALALPCFGKLANFLGLYRQTKWGVILLAIATIPLFYLMSRHQLLIVAMGQLLFVFLLSPYFSINTAMLASIFPPAHRYTLTAFILNASIAIFGATTPMVSLLLSQYFASSLAPGFYYLLLCLLVLAGLLWIKPSTSQT